jgi:hypothetical protein
MFYCSLMFRTLVIYCQANQTVASSQSPLVVFRVSTHVTLKTENILIKQETWWGLKSLPYITRVLKSRKVRWMGHVACMGEKTITYTIIVGKPYGKRPHGNPGRRWESSIKIGLKGIAWEGMDCINLAQDKGKWPATMQTGSIQCGEFLA